ncbi:MAG: hypothetical protein U5J97_02075 [Trueperaceae bacterium]|nr:hypothetical protein [Trueperaceae bacterium]
MSVAACDTAGTSSGSVVVSGGGHVRSVPVTRTCTDPSAQPAVALTIDRVYVNQSVPAQDSTKTPSGRIPLVANRGGLLRVFATADDTGADQASATLHYRYGGGSESTLPLAGPSSVPTSTSEGVALQRVRASASRAA